MLPRTLLPALLSICLAGCYGDEASSSKTNHALEKTPPSSLTETVHVSRATQVATQVSVGAHAPSARAAPNTSCMAVVAQNGKDFTLNHSGNPYYSSGQVQFTIKNTCSNHVGLSELPVVLTGVTVNSKSFSASGSRIGWINQDQLNGAPWLDISSTVSADTISLKLSTPNCSGNHCNWAKMPPNSTKTVTINTSINSGISSYTINSLSLNGTAPVPADTGTLRLTVDASAFQTLCTTSTCAIKLDIISPSSRKVATINLNPKNNPIRVVNYTGLLIGNYTVSLDSSSLPNLQGGSASYTTQPTPIVVSKNTTTNANTTLSYTPATLGSVTLNSQNFPDMATFANIGSLPGSVVGSSTHPFTIDLNRTATVSGLALGSYNIHVQGVADPVTASYYQADPLTATVVNGQNITKNLTFNKLAKSSLHKVAFHVTNLPATATNVSFAGQGAAFKYNTNTLTSTDYWFANSESAIAVSINPPAGYTLNYSPKVITPTTNRVDVNFQRTVAASHLTTHDGQIVDNNGNIIKLKGINWFGFNNGGTMLDGLWSSDPLSGDFSTTVQRIKALGFNAVRLPFSFQDLAKSPNNFTHSSCPKATNAQLLANLTNPSVTPAASATIPSLTYAPTRGANMCNDYLPNTSTMDRFVWTVDFFAKNGFYVLIDNHLREDQTLLNSGITSWANQWQDLATRIKNGMPNSSSSKVMFDLLNEPDNFGIRWEASGSKPSLATAYLAAMDAISTVLPNNIYMIEGTGQAGINANWGDGFATNQALINQSGLSNPNAFFTAVLSKPYVNQIVVSPHVYPPSVTNAGSDFHGAGLYNRLSNSFGYLNKTGYCVNARCHKFPIAIGEFGSKMTDARDFQFFDSFASYLNNTGSGNDGKHEPIYNWFYWSWNANSGDTGGIVDNSWKNINWNRIDYLSRGVLPGGYPVNNPAGIGLKPWYSQ